MFSQCCLSQFHKHNLKVSRAFTRQMVKENKRKIKHVKFDENQNDEISDMIIKKHFQCKMSH